MRHGQCCRFMLHIPYAMRGEHVLWKLDDPRTRAICMLIGRAEAAPVAGNTCCKEQLAPSCMWREMLLLVLPQLQHEHVHGDVDGRTEPTVGARRKLPFANALADFHQTKCSQVICKPARAMEPTAASDGHRIRANSNWLLSVTGGSYNK